MGRSSISLLLRAAGLALIPLAAGGQQPPSSIRSTTDVRPRIPDEHDRPYYRETQSHRGWEIREPQYTVFASTSQADARWAAGHVAAAWNNASRLAGRWTQVQTNPDFGLNSVQIVIDDEPLRDRDAPLTTVNVVGIQTQVQIKVAPGQPKLADQVVRLREATAWAMLHTAGLDSAAPPWVVAGAAAYAGRQGLNPQQIQEADAKPEAAHVGGQQWRFLRQSQDTLAYQRLDHAAANAQVNFLLSGNDAEHAPAMLAALNQAAGSAAVAAAEGGGFRNFPGDAQLASSNTALDALLSSSQGQFEQWKKEPLIGQPVFEPAADLSPELLAGEAEMLVLLKLHQRLMTAPATAAVSGVTRTKIITFDRNKQLAEVAARPATAVKSFANLASRLTDPSQPAWATLDVDGSLLLSTDTARLNELLAPTEQRYSIENQAGKTVLVRRLNQNQTLRGWLAENPKQKSRPLAKFEVASVTNKRPAAKAEPQPKKQARIELR